MTTNANQVILNIRFIIKPGNKEAFRDSLFSLVHTMSSEPAFVNSIISEDLDEPNVLNLYEIWQGTRESWLQEELPKPYRKEYEENLGDILEDRIISWLEPIGEWGSQLTSARR
jgi:quinol monooxygenase YgiN